MAPEVMTKQNHSYEVDYYALGVIIFELMLGRRPYVGRDRRAIREQILAKQTVIKKSEIPEGWSIEAADFVNKLLQRRPMMRLGWGGPQ
jgi:serine/threonine protein kinase